MITARRRLAHTSWAVVLLATSIWWLSAVAPTAAAACPITVVSTVDNSP